MGGRSVGQPSLCCVVSLADFAAFFECLTAGGAKNIGWRIWTGVFTHFLDHFLKHGVVSPKTSSISSWVSIDVWRREASAALEQPNYQTSSFSFELAEVNIGQIGDFVTLTICFQQDLTSAQVAT